MTTRFFAALMLTAFSPLALVAPVGAEDGKPPASEEARSWTRDFSTEQCRFASQGQNQYFILEPGYVLVLRGIEDEDTTLLVITVLDDVERVGNVETRVVEERETEKGILIEVSRNYYAICQGTHSVFYFGEHVDMYENGQVVSHEGSWRADSAGCKAGVMMPGLVLLGSRYYQEIAPGVALDRAEIISNTEKLATPAGEYDGCLKVEETTDLEPKAREYKMYAPGIGLIRDGDLELIEHGFVQRRR